MTTHPDALINEAIWLLALSGLAKSMASIANEARSVLFTPVAQGAGRRLALHALNHILQLELAFHLDTASGVLLRAIER